MLAAATRLIASLAQSRARRRRRVQRGGDRIDLRRTLRAERRNRRRTDRAAPLDARAALRRASSCSSTGSRSMPSTPRRCCSSPTPLCRRSRRANAFVFSTGLREITATLREKNLPGRHAARSRRPPGGGGTRIGENLQAFVREYGPRLLSPETLRVRLQRRPRRPATSIASTARCASCARRSAGIVWAEPARRLAELRPLGRRDAGRPPLSQRAAPRPRRERLRRPRARSGPALLGRRFTPAKRSESPDDERRLQCQLNPWFRPGGHRAGRRHDPRAAVGFQRQYTQKPAGFPHPPTGRPRFVRVRDVIRRCSRHADRRG